MTELKCESGLFLLVHDFDKDAKTATHTSVHLLDLPTVKQLFEKGEIGPSDRLFCIAEEFEIQEKIVLIQKGTAVLERVV